MKRLVPIVLALLLFATSARAGITIVGAAQGNASCSTVSSLTVNSSSGIRAGDVVFAWAAVSLASGNFTITTPTGFTLIKGPIAVNGTINSYLYQRVSDGTDGASYAFSLSGTISSGCVFAAQITYRGANTSAPVDGSITNALQSGTTIVLPAVSPAGASDTLVAFANCYNFDASTVASMTQELAGGATANVGVIYAQTLSASGSTGTRTATNTGSTGDGFLFAVAPGPGSLSLWGDN